MNLIRSLLMLELILITCCVRLSAVRSSSFAPLVSVLFIEDGAPSADGIFSDCFFYILVQLKLERLFEESIGDLVRFTCV